MRLDRFTQKSRAAIEAALSLAAEKRHAQVSPLHVLSVLLADRDGLVPRLLNRIGAPADAVRADADAALDALPKLANAAEPTTDPDILAILRAAEQEARSM